MDERKSRSRPPSFVGGESPVLRSRSSTCDSIQSGSSPSSSCNPNLVGAQQIPGGSQQRQIPIPSSGTSPKQYAGGFGSHYGSGVGSAAGGSSPNSSSSSSIIRQTTAQISAAAAAAAVSSQSKKSSSGKNYANTLSNENTSFSTFNSQHWFPEETHGSGSTADHVRYVTACTTPFAEH